MPLVPMLSFLGHWPHPCHFSELHLRFDSTFDTYSPWGWLPGPTRGEIGLEPPGSRLAGIAQCEGRVPDFVTLSTYAC